MKQSKHTLNIIDPCQEDWTQMTSSKEGKYCSSCSENVIDFTEMSDNDIIRIIHKNNGKLCGRFVKDQLNRPLCQSTAPTANSRLYNLLAGILLLSLSKNSLAEKQSKIQTVPQSKNENHLIIRNNYNNNKSSEHSDSLKKFIYGRVLESDTKQALEYVIIRIKNTNNVVTTDLNGAYKIEIPENLLGDSIVIEVSNIGYEKTEFSVSKAELPKLRDILLIPILAKKGEEIVIFLGRFDSSSQIGTEPGISSDQFIKKKKKWWQRNKKSCP